MTTTDPRPTAILDAAERDVADRDRLAARRLHVLAALQAVRDEAAAARARHAVEAHDVVKLETLSPARIWAALRRDHAERLDKERAEEEAARYAVGVAEARVAMAERELADVDARLAALGDVDTRRDEALRALEQWVRRHGGAAAADLDAIAREQGAVAAELKEVREAITAAHAAQDALGAAAAELRSAHSWATWDVMGGGMIGDIAKRNRMNAAAALMRQADAALHRLATELSDVGVLAVGQIDIDSLTHTMDIWFDNIFSDWAVKNRIQEALSRVEGTMHAVSRLQAEQLAPRTGRLESRERDLVAEREALLRSA